MKTTETWDRYRELMKEYIEKGDYSKPWEWPTIVATMYVGDNRVTRVEFTEINSSGVLAGSSWDDGDAHNLIHQRYHLLQWEKANPQRKISDLKTILEIGAGYGAMVILLSRLGFRGTYNIIDLPELERIQRQHLALRGIKCRVKWRECRKPDLFIAMHSLSEIPVEGRRGFIERIKPSSYMISYQRSYEGVNNIEYFKKFGDDWKAKTGLSYMSFQHPVQDAIYYLISVDLPAGPKEI